MKDPTNIIYYMRKRLNLTQDQVARATKLTAESIKQLCEKQNDIGFKGEEWVFNQERKKLKGTAFENGINPNYSNDPEAGFDILSFSKNGENLFIEVKTTTGNAEDNFFLSSSEIEKAKECLNNGLKYELHYLAFRLGLRTRERLDKYAQAMNL
ncbi:MAG TPA: DUF3883 domain-containing protein [Thermoclostridium sp.]